MVDGADGIRNTLSHLSHVHLQGHKDHAKAQVERSTVHYGRQVSSKQANIGVIDVFARATECLRPITKASRRALHSVRSIPSRASSGIESAARSVRQTMSAIASIASTKPAEKLPLAESLGEHVASLAKAEILGGLELKCKGEGKSLSTMTREDISSMARGVDGGKPVLSEKEANLAEDFIKWRDTKGKKPPFTNALKTMVVADNIIPAMVHCVRHEFKGDVLDVARRLDDHWKKFPTSGPEGATHMHFSSALSYVSGLSMSPDDPKPPSFVEDDKVSARIQAALSLGVDIIPSRSEGGFVEYMEMASDRAQA